MYVPLCKEPVELKAISIKDPFEDNHLEIITGMNGSVTLI